MHPGNLSIADFTYSLPSDRIAHYPLPERESSRLLICQDGQISESQYRQIHQYLPENALLVFNNTKVVEARILFRKASGARIELFCLEPPPTYGGMAAAMAQTGKVQWKCLIGGASKWKPGQVLTKEIHADSAHPDVPGQSAPESTTAPILLEARYLEKLEDAFLIELSWTPAHLSFAELLHQAGLVPLPPYIRREVTSADHERYQTVYARYDGSVAAPTAGLHFTEGIFQSLEAKQIRRIFVTLHVGAGTFLPVKSATMEAHNMHTEFIAVTRDTLHQLTGALNSSTPRTIIPVGTTSLRTIESLYWLGLKTIQEPGIAPADLSVGQWDPYPALRENRSSLKDSSPHGDVSPLEALQALLNWMDRQGTDQLLARTQLLITPGYRFRLTHALITNFHQPESTLLLLVAALIGPGWKRVYQYALDNGFRFLSYGDGCLLYPETQNDPS